VDIFIIPFPFDTGAQTGLHAALGRCGMGSFGRDQREDNGVKPPLHGGYGNPETGQAAADDK
jgi:hypothetical protein